jgi:hypothetical protein
MISVYHMCDQESLWIRPSHLSGSEWVFRIGRTRDIRFSYGWLDAAIPSHPGGDRRQPVDVRYAGLHYAGAHLRGD